MDFASRRGWILRGTTWRRIPQLRASSASSRPACPNPLPAPRAWTPAVIDPEKRHKEERARPKGVCSGMEEGSMRRPVDSLMRRRGLVLVFCAMLVMSVFPAATFAHPPAGGDLSVPPTGDPERNPYPAARPRPARRGRRRGRGAAQGQRRGHHPPNRGRRAPVGRPGRRGARRGTRCQQAPRRRSLPSRRRPSPARGPRSARTRSSRSRAAAAASTPSPAGSARSRSARATGSRSSAPHRAASGPMTRRRASGSRGPTTSRRCRSARSRSLRPTTTSSTPAPARATCPVTATSATAS